MKKFVLLAALIGCGGGGDEYTWGDATEEVVTAYCERVYECFGAGGEDYDESVRRCIDHSVYHMCGLDGTCGEPVDVDVSQCVADYADHACPNLIFNIQPESCEGYFEAQPES